MIQREFPSLPDDGNTLYKAERDTEKIREDVAKDTNKFGKVKNPYNAQVRGHIIRCHLDNQFAQERIRDKRVELNLSTTFDS